ncbi:Bgr_08870 family protein [Bartonella bilalgolemii]|uniref:Phage tail repeat domain-containing protein n=1 Tax=Bartonella bilalgolemii TaxID=2942911 RepID=A0ABT0P9S4_9HYPH|nr:phage tail repeat domain-containing protein [Bartonella sp. G70]
MTKTKKLDMELPKEGRFISSEFPILRENLRKIDQAIADVEEKIDEKAPLKHMHSIGDVTDLEATLKGKMAADKTFSFADLSDIEGAKDAANNYVLYKSSNNNFTFGSAISLLGAHQHKTEDIIGLDDFRAKINEDLTSYGRLTQANEWQSYNKFNSKVTMSGDVELTGNSSLSLTHNGEVVTSLSTTESKLKGPLKIDGEAVYTKSEIDKLMALFTKKAVEILMTESGTIPLPEGVTDDTEIEIWAWGGGNAGSSDGRGGTGGCCTYVRTRKKFLGKNSVKIGRGGKAIGEIYGTSTEIGSLITAYGGKGRPQRGGINGVDGSTGNSTNKYGDNGGKGGDGGFGGNGGKGGRGGDSGNGYRGGLGGDGGRGGDSIYGCGGYGGNGGNGGNGGRGGKGGHGGFGGRGGDSIYGCGGYGGNGGNGGNGDRGGEGGDGGNSVYGGGGGGGVGEIFGGGDGGNSVYGGGGGGGVGVGGNSGGDGGNSMWGGHGGKGTSVSKESKALYGGGGGGYFPGKDATSSSSGDGGDGAILLKFFI